MPHLPFHYALRNLGRRPLRSLSTAASSALVAALLVATAAFVRGLESTFSGAARADVAILLSRASEGDILRSAIAPTVASELAGVRGVLAVSPEVHMGSSVLVGGRSYTAFVRGVSDAAFGVHDALTLVEGTLPGPGELLVGRLAASQMGAPPELLRVGDTLELEGSTLRISGRFVAPGTTLEAELWTPIGPLRGLARRDDDSVVFAKLASADMSELQLFAARRQDLALSAVSSSEYYRALGAYFAPIRAMAWALAAMIAAASLFSGANTQNASVQDRLRELAGLRAMGYSAAALVRALAQESIVLAAAGGLLGVACARIVLARASFSIAMTAFSLRVDAIAILTGIAAVLFLGIFGVLPAAWRVLRMPVAAALKES